MGVCPDLSAPTVAITSPAAGAYITGTVNLQASASDDRGVTGVQWQVDGVNVGPVQTVAPYTYALDTTAYPDLSDHTITAVASDAVGHSTTSSPITVHIANPSTAAVTLGTYNGPGSGGSRRTYNATGSFGSPNFTNSLRSGSATWPGNPYANWGFVIQCRLVAQVDSSGHGFESMNGVNGDHSIAAHISGTQIGPTIVDTQGSTAWATVSNALAGSVGQRDWLNNAGGVSGTAFTGDILVQYRYQ